MTMVTTTAPNTTTNNNDRQNADRKTTITMMEHSQQHSSAPSLRTGTIKNKKRTNSNSNVAMSSSTLPPPISSASPRQRLSKIFTSRRASSSRNNNDNNSNNNIGTPTSAQTAKKRMTPPKSSPSGAVAATSPRDVISMPAVTMIPSFASSSPKYRKQALSPVPSTKSFQQEQRPPSPGPFEYVNASSLENVSQISVPTIKSTKKDDNDDKKKRKTQTPKNNKQWWCGETELDLYGNDVDKPTPHTIDDTSIMLSSVQFDSANDGGGGRASRRSRRQLRKQQRQCSSSSMSLSPLSLAKKETRTMSLLLLQTATPSMDEDDDDADTAFTSTSLSTRSRTASTLKKKNEEEVSDNGSTTTNDDTDGDSSSGPSSQQQQQQSSPLRSRSGAANQKSVATALTQKYCWQEEDTKKHMPTNRRNQMIHRRPSSQRSLNSQQSSSVQSSMQSTDQHFLVTMNSSSFGNGSSKTSNDVSITSTDFDQLLRAMKVTKYSESNRTLTNENGANGIGGENQGPLDIDSANPFVEVVQLDERASMNDEDMEGPEAAETSWWSYFNFENNNDDSGGYDHLVQNQQDEGIMDHNSHHDVKIVSYEIADNCQDADVDDAIQNNCTAEQQQFFEVVLLPKDSGEQEQHKENISSTANGNKHDNNKAKSSKKKNKKKNKKKKGALVTMLESLRKQEKKLGCNHPDVAVSYKNLGDFYYKRYHYDSCLKCYSETLRIQQINNNTNNNNKINNEEIVNTLNTIGKVYYKMGHGTISMDKHRQAYELLRQMIASSPTAAMSSNTKQRDDLYYQTLIYMGKAYYRVRNSLSTIRQSCQNNKTNSETTRLALPYDDFYKTGLLNKISEAHTNVGSYGMAVSLLEEKLQLLKSVGSSSLLSSASSSSASGSLNSKMSRHHHREAAATLRGLGFLCCKTGYYMEAMDYHDLVYDIERKLSLAPLHVASARILKGSVTYFLSDYDTSKTTFKEAIDILERSPSSSSSSSNSNAGKDNDLYPVAIRGLGAVQRELYEFVSAGKSLDKALKVQIRLRGVEHPETLLTRLAIAKLWVSEFLLEKAMKELTHILDVQTRIHGKKHPNITDTLETIGNIHALKGEFSSALNRYEQCFFMRERFLGIGHPQVASVLYNIANVHARDGKHERALRILTNVLLIRKETLGENHMDIARSLTSKGHSLVALGQMKEAMKCFSEGHGIIRRAVGGSHPAMANIHANLGRLYLHKCDYNIAQRHLREALDIYEAFEFNEAHPDVIQTKETLKRLASQELLCV